MSRAGDESQGGESSFKIKGRGSEFANFNELLKDNIGIITTQSFIQTSKANNFENTSSTLNNSFFPQFTQPLSPSYVGQKINIL